MLTKLTCCSYFRFIAPHSFHVTIRVRWAFTSRSIKDTFAVREVINQTVIFFLFSFFQDSFYGRSNAIRESLFTAKNRSEYSCACFNLLSQISAFQMSAFLSHSISFSLSPPPNTLQILLKTVQWIRLLLVLRSVLCFTLTWHWWLTWH